MDRFYSGIAVLALLSIFALPSQEICQALDSGEERIDWCFVGGEHVFFKNGSWKHAVQNGLQSRLSFTSTIEQILA